MAEYIEREALLEEINEKISNIAFNSPYQDEVGIMVGGMARIRDSVEDALAADVAPVVHGRWIPFHSTAAGDIQYCAACEIGCKWKPNYCPNCGCRMDGGNE